MRDWILILLPVAVVVYFLVYPDAFSAVVAWVQSIVR